MATVYRGTQLQLNRPVAIKFFNRGASVVPGDRERFQREELLAAGVEHASIPYVLTAGDVEHDGAQIPYFVMQFIDGIGLDVIMQKQRRMPLERRNPEREGIASATPIGRRKRPLGA